MADQPSGTGLKDLAIPETILEACDLVISPGALALLRAATLLAGQLGQDLNSEHLFVAALAIGMDGSEQFSDEDVSQSSFAIKPDPSAADSWLYEWFVERAGRTAVDYFIQSRVRGAFSLPPPRFNENFVSKAGAAALETRLSVQARALLGRASFIGMETVRDPRYGVRHIIASLVLPDRNAANKNLEMLLDQSFKDIKIADAAEMILSKATKALRQSDVIAAWHRLFSNPPPTPNVASNPTPHRPSVITLSGFTSDSLAAGKADPLGINPDVRAFARLVCLEQATPPLSICLFGEWGSGKSTFMERLQREIATLTRPKPVPDIAAKVSASADQPKFVENIVQIKFNAWHFADASLWASLTAVFFDQLRRGGYDDGGRASDYQALIGKVASRVRSLEADAAGAMEMVEDAQRKSDAAHKALDTAEKQLAANDLTLGWAKLQTDFENIRKTNEDQLKEVGRRIYRDDLASDVKTFAAAVTEAASTPGRIALIGRVLVGGGLPTVLGVVAIILIACIGVALPSIDPTNAATWIQRIVAWGAGTFAALGALWQAFKVAKPILDGAWKYSKAVEEARVELTAEVEKKRREAKAAGDLLKGAEATLAAARAPLSVYRDGKPADSPSTILRYFLFEDGDVRDYDKQVGIVSRARRSFEQLDSIVAKTRTDRKAAEEKRARGELLSLQEQARLTPTNGQGFLVPDRIVLYIDDLDRCTHDQVYAVLQAIHLLLSFELFVVVVGVDVRWIEGAVAKHFEADTLRSGDGVPANVPQGERRRRAIDYLEKIFQIPFWLERLNTQNETTPSGGSYAAYVRVLLKDNERPAPGTNIFKSIVPDGRVRPAVNSLQGPALPQQDYAGSVPPTGPVATVEEEEEFGALDTALASLKLEQREIDFLASSEVGAVASKSPRAVKRLINIYRIVRARLSDHELDQFLDQSGAPRYPIAALLAAIETGQPIELAADLYPALALLPVQARLNFVWTALERSGPDRTNEATKALLLIKKRFPELNAAFAAVDRLCGEQGALVGAYLQIARLVRRYSFNRFS